MNSETNKILQHDCAFSRAGGRCLSLVITSASISFVGSQEYEKISLSTNLSFKSTIVGLKVFLSTCLERKTLRPTIVDLKERLVDKDIFSYSWLPTKDMLADVMTKEMHLCPALEDVFLKNDLSLPQPLIN